jgi:adenine-specific DNA methylase
MKNQPQQMELLKEPTIRIAISTRFQGSKAKILNWIWETTKCIEFETCLDAFGGTGVVGYMYKTKGKQVHYNDFLKFNYMIGLATIENDREILTDQEVDFILAKSPSIQYPSFIQEKFKDIFYYDDENAWLDMAVTNIRTLKPLKRAVAFTALFQACIIKRPYNLFHRKNLYMRSADVKRNFGNKTTWDKPFPEYFQKFVKEVNGTVFSNGKQCKAFNKDIFEISNSYDLVYIDTPYINASGVGIDYLNFYHFLEGMVDYDSWPSRVDYRYKHRPLKETVSLWSNKNTIHDAFDNLFKHFQNCTMVVSYRSDGIPTEEFLLEAMKKYKKNVEIHHKSYKYVLSPKNGKEILLIGG